MPEALAGEVAPVEAPVEVVVTEPAAVAEDQKTEEVAETTEQQEAHKQSKFQRRLDRQKTARVAAETEARMLREQLARFEEQRKPQPSGEPKREQYASDIDYLEARTDWRADKKVAESLAAERAQASNREKQTQQSNTDTKLAQSWTERETAFQAKTKDYEDVVMPFIEETLESFSKDARRLIAECGPEMLYHLGKDEAEAERIANLSPVRQLAELGKLEDKLAMPAKKVSSAPAPANHVNSTATGSKDPSKMNQDEYRKWMAANGSRFVRQ